MKDKTLITGPESSGTRMVARFIADNFGLIDSARNWGGHDRVSDGDREVIHRSLPHGANTRDYFPHPVQYGDPNQVFVVICIRDKNIAIESAAQRHNEGSVVKAEENMEKAAEAIKNFLDSPYECVFFHYETAILLKETYLNRWMFKHFGIHNTSELEIFNGNQNYIKESPYVKTD